MMAGTYDKFWPTEPSDVQVIADRLAQERDDSQRAAGSVRCGQSSGVAA
jgi:hypothetical protein